MTQAPVPPHRARFAAVARDEPVDLGLGCALMAVEADPTTDVDRVLADLDLLAASVPQQGAPAERLRVVLGEFRGHADDFDDLRASLLPDVLARRRGLPILLSVVWLETARRAGLPAYGASLPGHYVVGLGSPDGPHEVVDPFRGGAPVAERVPLPPWDGVATLQRVLANIRHWADRPDRLTTRLWATELGLLLPRHPLTLRRERGELLVRLGDVRGGAAELEAYADAVDGILPEDAERARAAAQLARATLN